MMRIVEIRDELAKWANSAASQGEHALAREAFTALDHLNTVCNLWINANYGSDDES
jgi:hypothetical protein